MGWSTVWNGELLGLAVNEFDVFVTVDNLRFDPIRSSGLRPLARTGQPRR
jgi:hypothetical protein